MYVKYFLEKDVSKESMYTTRTNQCKGAKVRECASLGLWYKVVPLDTIWDDDGVRPVRHASKRELAVRYVTQKPESLLRRIIEWASEPNDVVADFFGGSGTTAAAAVDAHRRFLLCEQGDVGLAATRKRLEERSAMWNEYVSKMQSTRESPTRTKTPRVARGKP